LICKFGNGFRCAFAEGAVPDRSCARNLDVKTWVNEGRELAITRVYVPPIDNSDRPFDLPDSYEQDAAALAKQQVELAGDPLAILLNAELN
jgi:hypothetical protein